LDAWDNGEGPYYNSYCVGTVTSVNQYITTTQTLAGAGWNVYPAACGPNYTLNLNASAGNIDSHCLGFVDVIHYKTNNQCPISNPPVGDPIYPLTGSRKQELDLGINIGSQQLKITYDSLYRVPSTSGVSTLTTDSPPAFGATWDSNLHKILLAEGFPKLSAPSVSTNLYRGAAVWESAAASGYGSCATISSAVQPVNGSNIAYVPSANLAENLTFLGFSGIYSLLDADNRVFEMYSESTTTARPMPPYQINYASYASGQQLNYIYTNNLLTSVTDVFGRIVQFSYEQPADSTQAQRITKVTGPDLSSTYFGYDDSGNLKTVIWPDGNVLQYVYERPDLPWALTGVIGEDGIRFATYGYDVSGLANATALAGGVDSYSVNYSSLPRWMVQETLFPGLQLICRDHYWVPPSGAAVVTPNGQSAAFGAAVSAGMVGMTGQSQPAGSGCSASTSAMAYDSYGNVASQVDFAGNKTCYQYDTSRGLRTAQLEGLASSTACPSSLSGYVPSESDSTHPQRLTTTVWHPNWNIKIQEAIPKRITTWVYNGQTDPLTGSSAGCSSGIVANGMPLAVLCTRYEQATTDATGALGLSATVTGATRAWTYTYNAYGQVLTATDPKLSPTDPLPHTTAYAYYATTALSGGVGHTMGDLQTLTNPLGQVTTYTSYDAAGRLLSSTDPNGTVTTNTYWPRGWLHTQTVTPTSGAAQVTNYVYYPTGLLQTATLSDGTQLSYAYDTAHRLTDVTDGAGNTAHYTLDNTGNRTGEQVKDGSGVLAGTIARVFDNLNRVQSVTGAAAQ
jgi:YD repeat-containing protein